MPEGARTRLAGLTAVSPHRIPAVQDVKTNDVTTCPCELTLLGDTQEVTFMRCQSKDSRVIPALGFLHVSVFLGDRMHYSISKFLAI